MDRINKFYRKLSAKDRKRLIAVIESITSNYLDCLNIAPIKGKKWWFRCRVGDIRIIFIRIRPGVHVIHEIGFRGEVYKK